MVDGIQEKKPYSPGYLVRRTYVVRSLLMLERFIAAVA